MFDKLSNLFAKMNSMGVPIPLARDPKIGKGSLTFTLVVMSFTVCLVLLAGKLTKLLGEFDYDNALWLLGLTLSSYLGRQFQKNGKAVTIGGDLPVVEEAEDAGTGK